MNVQFHDSITAENSERYHLLIRLWGEGIAFSGYIPDDGDSFFYYETASPDAGISYKDWLKNIFFENEWMKYVYKSVNIVCVTEKYVIVPEDVYVKKGREELFSFCLDTTENHKIISRPIENNNSTILFELDSNIYEFLVRSFVNVNFVHYLSPLMEVWQQSSLDGYPKHLYVYVGKRTVDIAGFEHGNLLFANFFPYEKENDILYFVTRVSKQLNFDQLEDKLFFYGETAACDPLIKILRTYFECITLQQEKAGKYVMPADRAVPDEIITLTECGL
jgi:hypothetical protein